MNTPARRTGPRHGVTVEQLAPIASVVALVLVTAKSPNWLAIDAAGGPCSKVHELLPCSRTRSSPLRRPACNTSRPARTWKAARCPSWNGLVALAPEKSTLRLCRRRSICVSWPDSPPAPANIATRSKILQLGMRLRCSPLAPTVSHANLSPPRLRPAHRLKRKLSVYSVCRLGNNSCEKCDRGEPHLLPRH